MTAHAAHRLHSQFNYAKLRDDYAIANREPITINSEDAKSRGIKTGDLVRAYNDRGQVSLEHWSPMALKKARSVSMKGAGLT